MRIIEILKEIKSIFIMGKQMLCLSNKCIKSLKNDNFISIVSTGNVQKSANSFANLINNQIEIFDSNLKTLFIINDKIINSDSGITLFNENEIIVHNFTSSDNLSYFKNGVQVSSKNDFWGFLINETYSLIFQNGIFSNPQKFTFCNIFGDINYWEYECAEGFQAKNNWTIRGNNLLFSINKQGYFAGKFIKIDINTGVIKWQVDVNYTDMIYDETQGIFVSFWAGNNNGNNYQLIDIDNETIEIGEPNTNFELANVNTFGQLQFMEGTKLFFADNVHSYGDNTVPIKFGCFDIVTKKVIFLQEIPIEYGIQASQIIYNEDKLYIRMTENTLLIYENE